MALTTAAAILGSAAISGIAGAAASGKAAKASQSATDATLQSNREAQALQQANTKVARETGDQALTQLSDRLGLGAKAAPTAGAPNWTAYIAQHPDLQAAIADPNGGFNGATPEQKAQDHYQRYGQSAGWQLPTYTAEDAAAAAPKTDVQLSAAAQVPTYNRPTDQAAPEAYKPTVYEAPTYERPNYDKTLDVSYDAYMASPEAKAADYEINQQSGAAGSALAASGALKSGAAQKRLQQIGQDGKVKYYTNFRDYNTGQYNTDRARFDNNYNYDTALKADLTKTYDALNNNNNQFAAGLARQDYQYGQNRADNIFNTDRAYGTDLALNNRSYETSRYDTGTNNLFNLANIGQGAAAQTNQAAQNGVNNTSNALFSNAANQGNAALTGAAQLNNLLNTGVNALAYYNAKKTPATSGVYGPTA